jgi:phosphate transport system substrate-binding protein
MDMNDEFLYRLRKPPPADFATRLKKRLDRQDPASETRKRPLNVYAILALLVGGTAFAFASPTVRQAAIALFAELRGSEPQPVHVEPPTPLVLRKPVEVVQAPPPPKTSWRWGGESSSTAAAPPPAPPSRNTIFIVSSWPKFALNRNGRFEPLNIDQVRANEGPARFCSGMGIRHADIALMTRRLRPEERTACIDNGTGPLTEIKAGYEAIVFVRNVGSALLPLTRHDVFLALTQPESNPYVSWQQVHTALPNERIEVLGSSMTRDALSQLILEGKPMRTDGAYVETGDDESVLRMLTTRPTAVGIFTYGFVQQHAERVAPSTLDGVQASYDTMMSGDYTGSRPLYMYIKRAQFEFVPPLSRFIRDNQWVPQNVVSLKDAELTKSRAIARIQGR